MTEGGCIPTSGRRVDGAVTGRVAETVRAATWPLTATQPRSIEKESIHRTGRASIAASGTVHRRSVRPPQAAITPATAIRGRSQLAGFAVVGEEGDPVAPQLRGDDERDAGDKGGHPDRAVASAVHSRRTANQTSPTPGVTLVSCTNDQVPAHRKPSTIAAASSRWMFPMRISWLTGRASTRSEAGHGWGRATTPRRPGRSSTRR